MKDKSQPSVLVVVHVFYPEKWPELADCIRNVSPRDIIITYVDEAAVAQAKSDFPRATFVKSENRGYDVAPFLSAIQSVDLSRYDLVVKLHTKRDVGEMSIGGSVLDGTRWRECLLAFVRTGAAWRKTLRRFRCPRVGLVSERHIIYTRRDAFNDTVAQTVDDARKMLACWGLPVQANARFVGGTMFAVRASLLKVFQDHPFPLTAFSASEGHEHETLAHVLERAFGFAVCGQGKRVVAFNGSVTLMKIGRRVAKFVFDNRKSKRRHSIRLCKITVYRKKLAD